MSFFDYFRNGKKPTSAQLAKDRLQVIVAHERRSRGEPDYLPALRQEILEVIRKYINVDDDQISVQLDSSDDCSVLELNVTLPDRVR